MTRRIPFVLISLTLAVAPPLWGQRADPPRQQARTPRDSAWQNVRSTAWHHGLVRYGKWLTAGTAVAFTVLASGEHQASEREWDALLVICRSAPDACALGPDGRYVRADAERLYQRSRSFDSRARRRLLGAQATLLVATALFIIDLRPGDGPDNIPYSPMEVTGGALRDGAWVGVRMAF